MNYISGEESLISLESKYDVPQSVVFKWTKKYNNGMEITDYDPKGDIYTMKSRKTTSEECLEIVKWVIENDIDFKMQLINIRLNMLQFTHGH